MRLPTTCPKCQRERLPGEDACARCGLLVSRWEGFVVAEPTLEALDQPWADLQARWGDAVQHTRFIDLAASLDALDVAAAKYRRVRLAQPDDERAQAGLRLAVERAHALYVMKAQLERPPRAPVILKLVGTMFAGLILLAALWTLLTVFKRP